LRIEGKQHQPSPIDNYGYITAIFNISY